MRNRIIMGDSFMENYRKKRFLDKDFEEEFDEIEESEEEAE